MFWAGFGIGLVCGAVALVALCALLVALLDDAPLVDWGG